jgi:hypothetical protein
MPTKARHSCLWIVSHLFLVVAGWNPFRHNRRRGEIEDSNDLRPLLHQHWLENRQVPSLTAQEACIDDLQHLCRRASCGRYNVLHSIVTQDPPPVDDVD